MIICFFGTVGSGKTCSAVYEVYQLSLTCRHCQHTLFHGRKGYSLVKLLLRKKEELFERHANGLLKDEDYERFNIDTLEQEITQLRRIQWYNDKVCYHPNGCNCDHEERYRIYANMKLNFPFTPIDTRLFRQFKKNRDYFQDAVLLLDEIHIWLDSRNSMKNKKKTYFILQTRKVSLRLFCTTQHFSQVDKRLRNSTDILVRCSNLTNKSSTVIDASVPTLLMNEYLMQYDERQVTKVRYLYANPIYPLYNTKEVIEDPDDVEEDDGLDDLGDIEMDIQHD